MSQPPLDAWSILENRFPKQGTSTEQLKFLLNYAVLAPSGHNTQPWLFKIQSERVELYCDRTRSLPIVDQQHREMIISCGAALFNLRVAMRHFGYEDVVEVLPDPNNPDLLAQISLGPEIQTSTPDDNDTLFYAIRKRHTNRQEYTDQPLSESLLEALQSAAIAEHASLELFQTQAQKQAIADLVVEGDRRQMANSQFREELANWIHSNSTKSHDGMPAYAHGYGDLVSNVVPFVIRNFNLGSMRAKEDGKLVMQSPVVAVLGTENDLAGDWLSAGQALSRVLLRARADGVWAAYMNQPIEVSELRPQLSQKLKQSNYPQLILRLGYGPDIKPIPRRSVDEVLI